MKLVTGANGFVGRAIISVCQQRNIPVRGSVRTLSYPGVVTIGDITPHTDWSEALYNVDTVIHTAARVHVMRDTVDNPLEAFRDVNVAGTLNLAKQASARGVKRFIYLSSIKVNGEGTSQFASYTETDAPQPADPYGISKWEAEAELRQIADQTGLEVVIIRPPLVYGPSVKANFRQMLRAVQKGIPLPLGAIHNRRSLVYVENLADAIITAALHPAAANQTFLVSDGEDVSTTALIRNLARSLGRAPRLLAVPVWGLKLIGRLTGKSAAIDRLTGSLVIDSHKIRQTLGWSPPYTLDQGLQATADWFKSANP